MNKSGIKTESKLFKRCSPIAVLKSDQQREQIKDVINECNYQSEKQNKPLKMEINHQFRDYDGYMKRFENHIGVLN